jgi:hypothetical protein
MPGTPRKAFRHLLQTGLLAVGVAFLLITLIFFARVRTCPLLAEHVPFERSRVWSKCPLCADWEKVTIYEECVWRLRQLQGGSLSK